MPIVKEDSMAEAKADARCEKRGLPQPRCSRIPAIERLPFPWSAAGVPPAGAG